MRIELTPLKGGKSKRSVFDARLMNDTELVAEIKGAPLDIATRWAEIMRELHGDTPEIKRIGVCRYCGSTERNGVYCGGCERVLRG